MSTTAPTRDAPVIGRIPVPETLNAPDASAFLRLVELANETCLTDTGHDGLRQEPVEMLGFWHDGADRTMIGLAARVDGRIEGAASLMIPLEAGATSADFDLMVTDARWGEGIEDALISAAERELRAHGRSVAQTWTLHRSATPADLAPPTGFGAVPSSDRQTQLLLRHGYSLEQVERTSEFDLTRSPEPVRRMLDESRAIAGAEYRLLTWSGATPHEHRAGMAWVMSRMSTDAPAAGLDITEEVWDEDRVGRRDARMVEQHLTPVVAAILHVPTATIVGYNELTVPEDPDAPVHQYGTLVLREHRGHRLGTIVKCANILAVRDAAPHATRIITFNAEENRHMLDINEQVGFTAVSSAGAWKKELVS